MKNGCMLIKIYNFFRNTVIKFCQVLYILLGNIQVV
jgi:hypothetical protein